MIKVTNMQEDPTNSLHTIPASLVPVPVAGTGLPTPCDWHLKPWNHQHLQVWMTQQLCRMYSGDELSI